MLILFIFIFLSGSALGSVIVISLIFCFPIILTSKIVQLFFKTNFPCSVYEKRFWTLRNGFIISTMNQATFTLRICKITKISGIALIG